MLHELPVPPQPGREPLRVRAQPRRGQRRLQLLHGRVREPEGSEDLPRVGRRLGPPADGGSVACGLSPTRDIVFRLPDDMRTVRIARY